jgi:uroporphyrinogen decarboxylase
MNSRDIVKMSLAFASPPRIPYAMNGGFPSDIRGVGRKAAPNRATQPWTEHPEKGYWDMFDMWGNEWRRLEPVTKGEVVKGVIEESWDLLESYDWPQTDAPELYEEAAEKVKQYHDEGFYVTGHTQWPFDTARYMRRMEVFLGDCASDPERVDNLLKKVADISEREIHRFGEIGCDGIMSGEDWGTQDRLLISPPMFRKLFKPRFAQLAGAAHSYGMDVWFHSCGYVKDVIADWVEVGINVCQFDQLELHGLDFLAENFGGKLHYWSPVDIQTTLQTRDHDLIDAAAKKYIEKLAAPFGGGMIAGYYGSNEALGLTPEYQVTASEAYMKYGNNPWNAK